MIITLLVLNCILHVNGNGDPPAAANCITQSRSSNTKGTSLNNPPSRCIILKYTEEAIKQKRKKNSYEANSFFGYAIKTSDVIIFEDAGFKLDKCYLVTPSVLAAFNKMLNLIGEDFSAICTCNRDECNTEVRYYTKLYTKNGCRFSQTKYADYFSL